MKRIFHSGGSIVTGSDIADAVLLYVEALHNRSEAAVVDIPVVGENGLVQRAQLLIGPASQLVSVSAESLTPELVDLETTAWLRDQAESRTMTSAAWTREVSMATQFDEYDY